MDAVRCSAAARTAGSLSIDNQYALGGARAGTQQQTGCTPPLLTDRQDRQTDGRTHFRYIDAHR